VNDLAKKARAEYMAVWRKQNLEKVKRAQEKYWETRAKKKPE